MTVCPVQVPRCQVCGDCLEVGSTATACSEVCACRLLDIRKITGDRARYMEGNRLLGVDPSQLRRMPR